MRRGELWTMAGGAGYTGKPRPALIVQDDDATTSSVLVCPLTTFGDSTPALRASVQPSPLNGLREISWVMADKLSALPRSRLGRRLGALGDAEMADVERTLVTVLGLAR